jgi:hypothetical protein
MKKLMIFAVVAMATLALAAVSFACDKDGAAQAASGERTGGCQHAAMAAGAKADGGCQHGKETAAKAEKDAGCTHGAAAADAAAAPAKYEDKDGGCPMHSKASETQRAALLKGEKVTLTGYVVCQSCDLKKAGGCKSVFKSDGGEFYSIVANDAFEKLGGVTRHGEKKVEIVGTTAKDSDEQLVLVSSYKVL